jgi:hypothetical protein
MFFINKITFPTGIWLFLFLAWVISACSKTEFPELKDNQIGFNPATEKEEVNRILQVKGTYLADSAFPAKSGTITIVYQGIPFSYNGSQLFLFRKGVQDTIEVGNESNAFIPLRLSKVDKGDFFTPKFAYLKVTGAKGLWKIPVEPDPSEPTLDISSDGFCNLAVPALVREGDIKISICVASQCNFPGYTSIMVYSDTINALLSVRKPIPCGSDTIKGRAGLTIRKIDFGENALKGTVRIRFKSFGIPDRLDVRFRQQYVVSTCNEKPDAANFPSCKPDGCFKTTGVSGQQWFDYSFPFDPANGRYAEVLVRGSCDDPRTLWELQVFCPE